MTKITFPDNSVKEFENNPTGMDVANSISEGFARNCVAMKIDDKLKDLSQIIVKPVFYNWTNGKFCILVNIEYSFCHDMG